VGKILLEEERGVTPNKEETERERERLREGTKECGKEIDRKRD